MSIIELEQERWEWSKETFKEATCQGSLNKCLEEIKEIQEDIDNGVKNPYEYADAIMCLFDSAARQGIFAPEIMMAYQIKITQNKKRKWNKNADGSYSHIKP